MRKLSVEEYDRLSPVKKEYYCKALEREKMRIKTLAKAAVVLPTYRYSAMPFILPSSNRIFWIEEARVKAIQAMVNDVLRERERLKQKLEAELRES